MFEFWWLRIAIKEKTIAMTYRSHKLHESENKQCLSSLDSQIKCCIHAQTHFSTLFPHTFRIMFRFVLCLVSVHKCINYMNLLYHLVSWCPFGVSQVSFFFNISQWSCGSVVEHCVNSAKVVGLIPREHMY